MARSTALYWDCAHAVRPSADLLRERGKQKKRHQMRLYYLKSDRHYDRFAEGAVFDPLLLHARVQISTNQTACTGMRLPDNALYGYFESAKVRVPCLRFVTVGTAICAYPKMTRDSFSSSTSISHKSRDHRKPDHRKTITCDFLIFWFFYIGHLNIDLWTRI